MNRFEGLNLRKELRNPRYWPYLMQPGSAELGGAVRVDRHPDAGGDRGGARERRERRGRAREPPAADLDGRPSPRRDARCPTTLAAVGARSRASRRSAGPTAFSSRWTIRNLPQNCWQNPSTWEPCEPPHRHSALKALPRIAVPVVALALVLAGCSGQGDRLADDYRDGTGGSYVSGDGSVVTIIGRRARRGRRVRGDHGCRRPGLERRPRRRRRRAQLLVRRLRAVPRRGRRPRGAQPAVRRPGVTSSGVNVEDDAADGAGRSRRRTASPTRRSSTPPTTRCCSPSRATCRPTRFRRRSCSTREGRVAARFSGQIAEPLDSSPTSSTTSSPRTRSGPRRHRRQRRTLARAADRARRRPALVRLALRAAARPRLPRLRERRDERRRAHPRTDGRRRRALHRRVQPGLPAPSSCSPARSAASSSSTRTC